MTSSYYTPSGRLSTAAVPWTVLAAMVTIPAAWLYGLSTARLPLLITPFTLLAFALWVGLMTQLVARKAKVRNPKWMGKLGLVIGAVGWYVQWTVHAAVLLHDARLVDGSLITATLAALSKPVAAAGVAAGQLQTGWSVAGLHVPGGVIALLWVSELWIMLGFGHLYGRTRAAEPYCEKSDSWADKIEVPHRFAAIDPGSAASFLENFPDQFKLLLKPCPADAEHYAKLTIYRCADGCEPHVSIANFSASGTSKNDEKRDPVVELLRLRGAESDDILSASQAIGGGISEQSGNAQRPTPEQLLGAVDDLTAGRFELALAAASPHIAASEGGLRTDAIRICAMATAQLARWEESLGHWNSLFNEERSATNALQAATSAVMAGQLELGEKWLNKAYVLNAVVRDLPGLTIPTQYVSALTSAGQMQAALPYLDEIKKCYQSIGCTDSTYLWMQRLPLFSAFLDNSAPVIRAVMDVEQGRSWYMSMLPHLDESGKDELRTWLDKDFAGSAG